MSDNKTCVNCKHWNGKDKREKALCILSKMRRPIMSSGCGLYTASNFGCNQFQEKKEGNNETKKLVYVQ